MRLIFDQTDRCLKFDNITIRDQRQLDVLIPVPHEINNIYVNYELLTLLYDIDKNDFYNVFNYYKIYAVTQLAVNPNPLSCGFVVDDNSYWLTEAYSKEFADIKYINASQVEEKLRVECGDTMSIHSWFFVIEFNVRKCANKLSPKQRERICSLISVNQNSIIQYNGDYYRVTSVPKIRYKWNNEALEALDTSPMSKELLIPSEDYEITIKELKNLTLYVIYDVETMVINKVHQPYMICANIFIPGELDAKYCIDYTCQSYEECSEQACIHYMFEHIYYYMEQGHIKGGVKHIWLIGYNNFRFDDSFIKKYAAKHVGKYILSWQTSERKNEPNQTAVVATPQGQAIMKTADLIKWCPGMSLKQAAISYKLINKKVDFNIVKFNNYLKYKAEDITSVFVAENELNDYLNGEIPDELKNQWRYKGRINLMKVCEYYCREDVNVTMQLFNKIYISMSAIIDEFNELYDVETGKIINNFLYLKTPSTTALELQMRINQANKIRFFKINNPIYKSILDKAYYGGRTDFSFVGYVDSAVRYYDVCGMYSLAMKAMYPASEPYSLMLLYTKHEMEERQIYINIIAEESEKWRNTVEIIFKKRLNKPNMEEEDEFAFFDKHGAILLCDVFPPDTSMMLPTAPIGEKMPDHGSILFGNKERKNIVLTSVHIRALLYCHYQVVIKNYCNNIYYINMLPLLSQYNEILTQKKTEYQVAGNTSGRALIKLFLNSLYGKLCQNTYAKTMSYEAVIKTPDEEMAVVDNKENKNSFLYLGAFVTSYSNYVLLQAIYHACYPYLNKDHKTKMKVWYYSDTDSVMLNRDLAYNFSPTIGNQCGSYDFEKHKFNAVWEADDYDGMFIFGKKSYALVKNGELVEKKFKGLPQSALSRITFKYLKEVMTPVLKLLTHKEKFEMPNRLIRKRKSMPGKVCVLTDYVEEMMTRTLKVNNSLPVYLNAATRNNDYVIVDKYGQCKNLKVKSKLNENDLTYFKETGCCKKCGKIVIDVFNILTYQCYDCDCSG